MCAVCRLLLTTTRARVTWTDWIRTSTVFMNDYHAELFLLDILYEYFQKKQVLVCSNS